MAQQINQPKKFLQLTPIDHVEFNNVIETYTLTSASLERKIAEFFDVFNDFEGCKIMPVNGAPGLKCKLYFKPCPQKTEDGLYAVKVRGEANNNGTVKQGQVTIFDMVNTVNMLARSKQFELESDAQEFLAEFLVIQDAKFVDRYNEDLGKTVKVRLPKNWNNYTEEISDVVGNTRFQTPYLVVVLDLQLIVAKLFGKKDPVEEKEFAKRNAIPKDKYEYALNIAKVINPQVYSYILEIRRINKPKLQELANEIGYGYNTGGNIIMTRR